MARKATCSTGLVLVIHLIISALVQYTVSEEPAQDYNFPDLKIKLLGNQGIIVQPFETPYFSDSFIYVDILINLNNKTGTGTYSELESPEIYSLRDQSLINNVMTNLILSNCDRGNGLMDPNLQQHIKRHLADLETHLSGQELELSIPLAKFEQYHFTKVLKSCDKIENTNSINVHLSLPVREKNSNAKFVQLEFIEFLTPGGLCVSTAKQQYTHLALLKNGQLFPIPHLTYYESQSQSQANCDRSGVFCQIPKNIQSKYLIQDPCIDSITSDSTLDEIHKACRISCPAKLAKPTLQNFFLAADRPKLIEVGDTLYISNAVSPLELKCANSTEVISIIPPKIGAIEMKIHCGCVLYYSGTHIWSRETSLPPTCTTDDVLEVFQVLPSIFVTFDDTKYLPKSQLEPRVYYNISGTIITVSEYQKMESEKWIPYSISIGVAILLVGLFEFLLHKYKKNQPNPLVLPAVALAVPAPVLGGPAPVPAPDLTVFFRQRG